MSKPNGISLTESNGFPRLSVTHASAAEDAAWEAVRQAIWAGWDAQRFKRECAQAWGELLREDAKDAEREMQKP